MKKNKQPVILTIFGITSDLASKKILSSFYTLYKKNLLPEKIKIIGVSRKSFDNEQLKKYIAKKINIKFSKNNNFLNLFTFSQVDIQSANSIKVLKKQISAISKLFSQKPLKLFYLALPPSLYPQTLTNFCKLNLIKKSKYYRLALEKPFGKDMNGVKKTENCLQNLLQEKQIFRIDHYLAKSMLKNILAFRFANNLFRETWNCKGIEKIEIKMLEDIGIPGPYYDTIGALRDVGQNHLLQMLTAVTMSQPKTYSAKDIRTSRSQLLKSLAPMNGNQVKSNTIRGQYKGYRKLKGVDKKSQTETYFKIKTNLNCKRWENTQIILQSGKKFAKPQKEIIVHFRHPHPCLCPADEHYNNKLSFVLSPLKKQGINILFFAKKPGLKWHMQKKILSVKLTETKQNLPEYAQLFYDFIANDQTLFVTSGEVKSSWHFIDAILKGWCKNIVPLINYQTNSSKINA